MKVESLWQNLIKDLSDREREILERYAGIRSEKEKLASIGRDFGITRERVRQLKEKSIKRVLRNFEQQNYKKEFFQFLKERTNSLSFRSENYLEKILLYEDKFAVFEIRIIQFLIQIHPEIPYYPEDQNYYSYFATKKEAFISAQHALNRIKNYFEKNKKKIHPEEVILHITEQEIKNHFHKKPSLEEELEIISLIRVLAKNPFGYFGHIQHHLINPKALKHKIFLILHNAKKPLHYSEIYQILEKLSQQSEDSFIPNAWRKQYTVESIKNELIKNKEFVFVGKGSYGLKEWGLEQGSAKDLLFKMLKKEKKISLEMLWKKISNLRNIKKTSFLIYLKSSPRIKIQDGYVIYKK